MSASKQNTGEDLFQRKDRPFALTSEQRERLKNKLEEELEKRFAAGGEKKPMNSSVFNIKNGLLLKYTGQDSYVEIPDGVAVIADFAFAENNYIRSVVMQDSVTEIGRGAFAKCESLTNIKLSDSLTEIAPLTFSHCRALTDVVLPHKLKSVKRLAFYECESLASLVFPEPVLEIGGEVFGRCTALPKIELPPSLRRLGDRAFNGCTALQEVVLGERTELGCEIFLEAAQDIRITYAGSSADFITKITSGERKPRLWESTGDVVLHTPITQNNQQFLYSAKKEFCIEVYCKKDKKCLLFRNTT